MSPNRILTILGISCILAAPMAADGAPLARKRPARRVQARPARPLARMDAASSKAAVSANERSQRRRTKTTKISLAPGKSQTLSIPVPPTGALLQVSFVPAGFTPKFTKAPGKARRLLRSKGRVCSFRFLADGKRELRPSKQLSGPDTTSVVIPKGSTKTVSIELRSASRAPIRGVVKTSVAPAALSATALRQKRVSRLIATHESPATLALAMNLLERAAANFPGGQSPMEKNYSALLTKHGVKANTVKTLGQAVSPFTKLALARLPMSSPIRNISLQRPVTKQLVVTALKTTIPKFTKIEPKPADPEKYLIRIDGIKSHRDADDVGAEWGPDTEEPYIAWTCYGPGFFRVGCTESASVALNEEDMYSQDTLVFGEAGFKPQRLHEPTLFLYQVIENDPGGPSRAEVKDTLEAAFLTGMAIAQEDWIAVADHGIDTLVGSIEIITKVIWGKDDCFPMMRSVFYEDQLKELTTGARPPLDQNVFDLEGSFDHLNFRKAVVRMNGKKQWTVYYTIMRQSP